jgi:hypothetical protein
MDCPLSTPEYNYNPRFDAAPKKPGFFGVCMHSLVRPPVDLLERHTSDHQNLNQHRLPSYGLT